MKTMEWVTVRVSWGFFAFWMGRPRVSGYLLMPMVESFGCYFIFHPHLRLCMQTRLWIWRRWSCKYSVMDDLDSQYWHKNSFHRYSVFRFPSILEENANTVFNYVGIYLLVINYVLNKERPRLSVLLNACLLRFCTIISFCALHMILKT